MPPKNETHSSSERNYTRERPRGERKRKSTAKENVQESALFGIAEKVKAMYFIGEYE